MIAIFLLWVGYLLKTDKGAYVRWDFRIVLDDGTMLIIEFNGPHHYGGVNWSGCLTEEELERQSERQMYNDKLKADY